MGRSQVKYNQTHGRPGTKGRGGDGTSRGGGGGRGGGRTRGAVKSYKPSSSRQGDNTAWRYDDDDEETMTATAEASGTDLDHEQEVLLLLELETLPKYVKNIPDRRQEEGEQQESVFFNGIDLSSMGKALDQLSVAERLGIPAHLTVDLLDIQSTVVVPETLRKETREGQETNVVDDTNDEDDDDEAEDDLNAWLDSVIA